MIYRGRLLYALPPKVMHTAVCMLYAQCCAYTTYALKYLRTFIRARAFVHTRACERAHARTHTHTHTHTHIPSAVQPDPGRAVLPRRRRRLPLSPLGACPRTPPRLASPPIRPNTRQRDDANTCRGIRSVLSEPGHVPGPFP